MAKIHSLFFFLLLSISSFLTQAQIDQQLVTQFVADFPGMYGISDDEVKTILSKAEYKADIIEKITKPAEGTMTWERYRNIFMKDERINAGVDFWKEHKEIINNVSEQTGIPEQTILGILGVETFFGQRKGSYRVLDALYTLSFGYPKRSKFFRSELEEFIVLCHKEKLDIYEVKGSYAGAIGYCQFMPSSYRAYAVSYDDDGSRDLSNQVGDAIASIANYLKEHRWKEGEPVATIAKTSGNTVELPKQSLRPKYKAAYYINQGYEPSNDISSDQSATLIAFDFENADDEFWFCFDNFHVITRYNHSQLYALAVYQLGEAIAEKM
ncbi:MAG: lytic murein transglycosylase B [Cyclobacteriaceae bacterium]